MTTQRISRLIAAVLAALIVAAATMGTASASQPDPIVADQAALIFEINRARWDPNAFRARAADIDLPASVLPAPPLAPNSALTSSAAFKANEIADNGYFAHQSAVTGIWPNQLARMHGYPLPSDLSDTANNIESLHGGSSDPFRVLVSFANSPSHRRHIFGEGWFANHRHIGVGRSTNQNYWAVHTAFTGSSTLFVTGFVYDDLDGDGLMQRGEGLGGVTVTLGSTSVTSNAGGAYAIPVTPGTHQITFNGGALPQSRSGWFTATSYNVSADYILGDPRPVIRAYQLCDGLAPTILGTDGDDVIHATPARDIIHGLGGNDTIIGVGADDIVCVGSGNATLVNGGTVVERLAGADRFATATSISRAVSPDGADVVYLATGGNYPDALSAGPAVASRGAIILLVHRDSIPSTTADELKRLAPSHVVILGGTDTVSASVVAAVRDLRPGASVTRLAGPTRFETSVTVSQATFGPGVDTVYVASGLDFPDSLVSVPAAYRSGGPLLLVRSDEVPDAVRAELARLGPSRIVIVGSQAAVSDRAASVLARYAPTVQRIAGPDRFATAVEVSKRAFPGGASTVYIAVGGNFPDALTGASAIHSALGPILLVNADSIPQVVRAELLRLSPQRVVILGGPAAVSMAVQVALAVLLG